MIGLLRVTSYLFRIFKISSDKRKSGFFRKCNSLKYKDAFISRLFHRTEASEKIASFCYWQSWLLGLYRKKSISSGTFSSGRYWRNINSKYSSLREKVLSFYLWICGELFRSLEKNNNVSDYTDESWNCQTGNTMTIRSNFKVYYTSKYFRCFEMPRFALIEKPLPVDWNQ